MSSFDKTVANIIDGITKDAETVGVVDHVLNNYNLNDSAERRMARIYIQAAKDELTAKAKAAKVAAMSRAQVTTTTTEATQTMIEVVVDNKGATKQVINHGIPSELAAKAMTTTTSAVAPAVAPEVVTVEATTVTTEPAIISVSHIESEHLRNAVEKHLDEWATYGELLSYPVFRETGTSTDGHSDYMLIKGRSELTAYAYNYYCNSSVTTFTAIILDSAGKVKQVGAKLSSSHYLPQYVLRGLFEKTTTKSTKPSTARNTSDAVLPVVATNKAVETKPAKVAKAITAPAASLDVLAKQVLDNYHTPMMKLKASVNAYLVAEGTIATLGSKATKAEVMAQAHNIITCAGLEVGEPPAKSTATKATTKTAKTEKNIPTSDVIKKAAAAAGVDVSNVNFRSSTQRATLAVQLGLM